MTTHASDFNDNDYMSLEKNIDFPMNFVPKPYSYQLPGFYFDPSALAAQAMQAALMKSMAKAAKAADAAGKFAGKMSGTKIPGRGGGSGSKSSGSKGIEEWIKSGRFDFPYGKEIDFFHNRLCFDKVCRHDPEMTQDLNMEWLRRAAPAYDTKSMVKLKVKPVQLLMSKPALKYSIIPYGDVKNGSSQCTSGVIHLPNGLHLKLSDKSTQDVLGIPKVTVAAVPPYALMMMRQSINSFI